jgi:hypothetical protein
MKTRAFRYLKEKGEIKDYDLLIIKEDDNYMEGVSMKDLSEIEKAKLIEIYKEFEEKLQPYMKNYRRFMKNKVIG